MTYDEWRYETRTIRAWTQGHGVSTKRLEDELRYWLQRFEKANAS